MQKVVTKRSHKDEHQQRARARPKEAIIKPDGNACQKGGPPGRPARPPGAVVKAHGSPAQGHRPNPHKQQENQWIGPVARQKRDHRSPRPCGEGCTQDRTKHSNPIKPHGPQVAPGCQRRARNRRELSRAEQAGGTRRRQGSKESGHLNQAAAAHHRIHEPGQQRRRAKQQPDLHTSQLYTPGLQPHAQLQVRDHCTMISMANSTSPGRPAAPPHALRIGLTMGDPAGIGPEVCLKAIQALRTRPQQAPVALVLYGDAALLDQTAHALSLPTPAALGVEVKATASLGPYVIGKPMANSGEAAARSIEAAAQDCRAGRLDAMVTAPIHKGALALTGRTFPGHTEMLASLCDPAHPPSVRMMLVNPHLRVVLNSIHLPLRMAIEQLNGEALLETLHITHQALSQRFSRPLRIALAGLNPHASDGGLFGSEEAEILSPTVARARALGLPVSGPHSPDSVFRQAWGLSVKTRKFDVVVCLYHDQGLIPVKLLGIDDGVNCTLGLPFIRTSVDHGTAFEIAGQNQASPDSMIAAIHTAARLCRGGI